MKTLYDLLVSALEILLPISAWFSPKMKLFVLGRKQVFDQLEQTFTEEDQVIWFHAASLGEYEQGVPVMEAVKKNFPDHKILITFFSPSGYEIKKNNPLAACTTYLPLDTRKNAREFLRLTKPVMAIFIKYEIWPNYLLELKKKQVKTLLISGLFREDQIFFQWYGAFMRQALHHFDQFFVQDENSKNLLASIDIPNVSISGDTRFDRVSHQIEQDNTLDFVEKFKENELCLVCGSTWPEDEAVLVEFINNCSDELKFIIAPHEIKPLQIKKLKQDIRKKVILYSEKKSETLADHQVLIIDTIGLLTKIYSYADIAYVGGAMGSTGLHNILEPATFGIPIIIGKNFQKFPEAHTLYKKAGLFAVDDALELNELVSKFLRNGDFRKKTGMIAGHFVQSNTGATRKIMDYIRPYY